MGNPAKIKTKGIHHLAFACRDVERTYDFYANKLGFPLVHCENHRQGDGYFRHFFFDLGNGECLGFFDIHDVGEKKEYKTAISVDLGMPLWVNHISFKLETKQEFDAKREELKARGVPRIIETDHGWGLSLYMVDPNGIMVEYTVTVKPEDFPQTEEEALRLLRLPPGEIPASEQKEVADFAKVVA